MRSRLACSFCLLIGAVSGVAGAEEPKPKPELKAAPEPPASWAPPPYYDLYPETLPYERGQPVPLGYVVEKTHGTWGIVVGSILVGSFFTYGLLAAKNLQGDGVWLALPVLGPPALLATHRNHCKPKCFGIEQDALIIDSVGQGVGATLFILGLTLEGSKLVRQDLAGAKATGMLVPMRMGSGYGVGAVGSF